MAIKDTPGSKIDTSNMDNLKGVTFHAGSEGSLLNMINVSDTSQLKGVSRSFSINPDVLNQLAAENSQSEYSFDSIVSILSTLKQQLVDTASMAVMYCTEQVVTDTNNPKYLDSQSKSWEWVACLGELGKYQKKLYKIRDSINLCLESINTARIISGNVTNYLSQTASDFAQEEDNIRYVWSLKT